MIIFNIENVRKAKGLSLNQLHKRTGISRAYLFDLENNRRTNPSTTVLQKIAEVLEVNIKELFYSELDIKYLRKELYRRIDEYGIQSSEALEISQIIDLLVNVNIKKIL